jgi:hypothetical protein
MNNQKEVLADIEALLMEDIQIVEPQKRNEFTATWYASKSYMSWFTARRKLETAVKNGSMSVRRHVPLTWNKSLTRGSAADVY